MAGFARQHRFFGTKSTVPTFTQHTWVIAVEPLVISRSHGIARGRHIAVVHQQMLRPEMGVEYHRQQRIGHPALHLALLMHQLMGVVDPYRSGNHPKAKEYANALKRAEVFRLGHIP